jgi:hypothetical protein
MGGHKYTGRIKYEYRVLQSEPFPTRTEAEAASATIPTGETGSEIYVYRLDAAGGWADNERRTSGR